MDLKNGIPTQVVSDTYALECMYSKMYRHALRRQWTTARPVHATGRRWAHAPTVFNWEDPLDSNNLFTEEELAIQDTAKSYCQERMLPRVLGKCQFSYIQTSIDVPGNQMPTGMRIMTERSSKRWVS